MFPALRRAVTGEADETDRWRVEDQQPLFCPPRPSVVSLTDTVLGAKYLAGRLPAGLRFGSSSWTFPGWPIWDGSYTTDRLVREGLAAYASHPLFRTVGLDRTWYKPAPVAELKALKDQVPNDFQFLVKAHEDLTMQRFPRHARYGSRAGQENPRFLNAEYAMREVVGPFIEGLGAGVLLFPFAPQGLGRDFVSRLDGFLRGLPRGPWRYAVEVRNPDLLTPAYADVLASNYTLPALVGWAGMPSVVEQARRTRALDRPERVVRWMLHPGMVYDEAKADYAPFTVLKEPDPAGRDAVVEVIRGATAAWVVVNNKAEGCAPLSIAALAERLAERVAERLVERLVEL
jgi:uncharacterized protein YecE (DUF72 family)